MGPSFTTTVGAEEIKEDCCIQRADRLLTKVVIIGLNLWATEAVRALSTSAHHLRVRFREFAQGCILVLQVPVGQGSNESVKLFFLIANTVLSDYNAAR